MLRGAELSPIMPARVRAFICGCAGHALSDDERRFLDQTQPWGLILFKRNVDTPDQVRRLTETFRESVGRADAPVLVDQEGGRVQRLGPPHWPAYPAGARYSNAGTTDDSEEAARLGGRLIAADLRDAGITIDCAPVLDVLTPATHQAIGTRAYGNDPKTVARLGRAFADGLLSGGVLPVIKHMPGHGRAKVDSHVDLPVVDASLDDLNTYDFMPFAALADLPIGMTAHLVYTALDPANPATTSKIVIEQVIRGRIGFDGLLLSDDLSMEALKGSLRDRAAAAISAGVDIALHCNGKIDEARDVAEAVPLLQGKAAERAAHALGLLTAPAAAPETRMRARLDELLPMPA